jgi:hypothetical protein
MSYSAQNIRNVCLLATRKRKDFPAESSCNPPRTDRLAMLPDGNTVLISIPRRFAVRFRCPLRWPP